MSYKFYQGDLAKLDPKHQAFVIVQQVNCQGAMGAGLSGVLMDAYDDHKTFTPQLKRYYLMFINGRKDKDPNFQPKNLLGAVNTSKIGPKAYVTNIFGQEYYGRDGKHYTNEKALKHGLDRLFERMNQHPSVPVYIPDAIGAGLAGGNKVKIHHDIKELSGRYPDVKVCMVKLAPGKMKPASQDLADDHVKKPKPDKTDDGPEM